MRHLEDQLHKQVANLLFQLEGLGKFGKNGFFTYFPAGEKRNAITGSLLKAKGTRKGVPDFMIILRDIEITSFLWIECKTLKGKQTTEQKEFEHKTTNQINENYIVIRSLEELMDYLHKIKLL
ncbi:hypothetical protein J5751_05045 [bacterium]|nr:hypothetical protein [bacterium]